MRFLMIMAVILITVPIYSQNINNLPKYEGEGFRNYDLICLSSTDYDSLSGRDIRMALMYNLNQQVGIKEITSNRSPEIDQYALSVGFKPIQRIPYCAASAAFNYSLLSVPNPNSAWSPNFARKKDVIWQQKTRFIKGVKSFKIGDAVTYYYNNLGRVGHVGILLRVDRQGNFIVWEGNTNINGSRTGDGVYLKKRRPRQTYAVTRYIKK